MLITCRELDYKFSGKLPFESGLIDLSKKLFLDGK